MRIGQVALDAQVHIQTLRYYERIGLLEPDGRTGSGYREYRPDAVDRVVFIKRAQDLGFSLAEIRELLQLRGSSVQARQLVRRKASAKVEEIRAKIAELKKLESTLKKLIADCARGEVSGPCPILERMERK